uniref:C-type lectin domain-containing protein n=1 Tax=Syphacia muris TaxID=451379 RepID=A0A0N5AFP5_9BILA
MVLMFRMHIRFAGTIGIAGPSLVEETNYVNEPIDYRPSLSAIRSMFPSYDSDLSGMIAASTSTQQFSPTYSLVERYDANDYGYTYNTGVRDNSYMYTSSFPQRFVVISPTYREIITPVSPVYSSYKSKMTSDSINICVSSIVAPRLRQKLPRISFADGYEAVAAVCRTASVGSLITEVSIAIMRLAVDNEADLGSEYLYAQSPYFNPWKDNRNDDMGVCYDQLLIKPNFSRRIQYHPNMSDGFCLYQAVLPFNISFDELSEMCNSYFLAQPIWTEDEETINILKEFFFDSNQTTSVPDFIYMVKVVKTNNMEVNESKYQNFVKSFGIISKDAGNETNDKGLFDPGFSDLVESTTLINHLQCWRSVKKYWIKLPNPDSYDRECPRQPQQGYLFTPEIYYKKDDDYCLYVVLSNNVFAVDMVEDYTLEVKKKQTASFEEAEEHCVKKFNGHLASVGDEVKNHLLHDLAFVPFGIKGVRFDEVLVGFQEVANGKKAFTDGSSADYIVQRAEQNHTLPPLCYTLRRFNDEHIDTIISDACREYKAFICEAPIPRVPPFVLPAEAVEVIYEGRCSESSKFVYVDRPLKLWNTKTNVTFCMHDIVLNTTEYSIYTFEESEAFCQKNFNGHLLSVSDRKQADELFEMLFVPFDPLLSGVQGRLLGLKFTGQLAPKYTDFSDGVYTIITATSDKFSVDMSGECFLLVRDYDLERDTIWRYNCQRKYPLKFITCNTPIVTPLLGDNKKERKKREADDTNVL